VLTKSPSVGYETRGCASLRALGGPVLGEPNYRQGGMGSTAVIWRDRYGMMVI
jgi:hypothetical protein